MMTSNPSTTTTSSTPSVISTTSTATTSTSTSTNTTTTTAATSSNCSDYTIINQYPNTLQTFNKQSNNNDNLSVFYLNHSTNIIDHYNQSLLLNEFNHKQINKSIENGNQSITPINLIDFIDKQLNDKKSFKYDIIIDNSIINDSKDSMDDNNANTVMYMINNQQQQQSNSSHYDSNHDNISSVSTDF
ncbi:long-chain fatty acid transporter fat1, variant 2, partial [Schistosoma haematobium]